jgi:type I restriction enzyme S subunit
LFRGEIDDCVHQNRVIRVRPERTRLLPEFLNAYFNSSAGQQEMLERSRTTSGLFNLSVGRIKQIEVPLPSLEVQRGTITYLDNLQAKVDSLARLQAETAAELEALLPSMLDRAFKGKL